MFTKIFQELGLTKVTERVFDELVRGGAMSAKVLSDKVGIPRPSVYDHLKMLIQHGIVSEKAEDGKKVFFVDDVRAISDLLSDRIKSLQEEKKKFETELPSLLKKTSFVEPKIKFYSGKDGVKQVLNAIMLNSNIETELMWPMSEMMKVLGDEYLKELNEKRVKRNIYLRVIWPEDKKLDIKKYPYLAAGVDDHLRELRFAPKGVTWEMGYWMYDDKVAFLSSEKEGFGFVVQSKEFSHLLRIQFEEFWKKSQE